MHRQLYILLGIYRGLDKMNKKRKFRAKVIGKWVKGIIWKHPQLSVEFIEDVSPKHYDIPVSMAFWNAVEKETTINFFMEQNAINGRWYLVL